MLKPPGKIKLVALYVNVSEPANITVRSAPAAIVPSAVMAVVPVTLTTFDAAAPMSVVAADATVAVALQFSAPVMVSPMLATAPNTVSDTGSSPEAPPVRSTIGRRAAIVYASVIAGCDWKLMVVALVAKPTFCTTLPEALGIVAPAVPAVVCRNTSPPVCPDTWVLVPSK